MAFLRGRLRVFATSWLLFQIAWLTALVPRDCCAAHRPAECQESPSAHHATPPESCAAHDDHAGAHGSHVAAAAEHHHEHGPAPSDAPPATPAAPPTDCLMGRACDGPMAALLALLSNHGIVPDAVSMLPPLEARRVGAVADENVRGHFPSPESPPPRS